MDPRSSRSSASDALVLAVDETTLGVGAALVARRRGSGDWPLLVVEHAGEVLRDVHRRRPKVLFVCAAPARIDSTAELIAELDRRLSRGNPPLVALAATHDEAVERAVRVAGSSCYLALDSPADEELLEQLLGEAGIAPPPASGAHAMRASPQRGLPPPPQHSRRGRTRSRPSFRD
jgi:hypothetical protein